MKKILLLLCCLLGIGYMLYETGFFTYIQNGGSVVEPSRAKVELHEYSRTVSGMLKPLQDGLILKPDPNAYDGSTALHQFVSYQWPGSENAVVDFWSNSLERAVDKIVTVSNEGNIPVYVRVVFAFEQLDCTLWKNFYTAGGSNQLIHHGTIIIHDEPFDLFSYTYAQSLSPGETAPPCLLQIALDANASATDLFRIASGYEISSVAQVCQATGLPPELMADGSPAAVLNSLLGVITTEQHPWVGQ